MGDLTRLADDFAPYDHESVKVRHAIAEYERGGDFDACHNDRANLLTRIEKLESGLREVRDVASCSEGVEFYAMIAGKALAEGSDDG